MDEKKIDNPNKRERLFYLDALRGFAILLVVVGHLIQYNYQNALENTLFNAIYSFHMPLFFFVSGVSCFLSKRENGNISGLLKRCFLKFQSLIVPSLSWGIVMAFIKGSSWQSAFYAHWFLYTLFVVFLLWYVKESVKCYWGVFEILFYIVILILFYFDIKRIPLMYLSLFCIGYYTQKFQFVKIPLWLCSILFSVFIIGIPFFHYGDSFAGDAERVWVQFPVSVAGSLALLKFFYEMQSRYGKRMKQLAQIGRCTLGIYLTHFFFLHVDFIAGLQYSCSILVQFVVLIVIAYAISIACITIEKGLSIMPLASMLLYGKKTKNERK
ncbi:MAG: acyltransferase family protein [Bacteroidales bacterium]|nr:acyltransferase family protein [Bacteroidales bacterium]